MNKLSFGAIAKSLEGTVRTRRELGWSDGSLYYAFRALDRVSAGRAWFAKYYLMVQEVAGDPRLPPGRGRDIEIREIPVDDALAMDFPRPAHVVQQRYDQGAICLGAFKKGIFVGYHWLMMESYLEDVIRTRFHPEPPGRAAWNFDLYVKPEHRLGLTFPRIWDETHAFLHRQGRTLVMSRISAFNIGSITSHLAMGATCLGWAAYLHLGSFEIMLSSLAPRIYISSRDGDVPEVRIDCCASPL